jgi:hypothetical protein
MSFSATVDRPEKPRPIFEALPAAVRAAINHGNGIHDIKPHKWAESYHCDEEDVRAEFERQMSKASLRACSEVCDK